MDKSDAYSLKRFYNKFHGRVMRRILRDHLVDMWPETKGLTVMGYGYTPPYMRPYLEKSERSFVVFPSQLGAHHWPDRAPNLVCVSAEDQLPIETNSIDRIIIFHALEFLDYPDEVFAELWRVLKSTGKIMVIVPNRMGLWARADWTPFGQGRPYSAHQVENLLHENRFVHERTRHALFSPAFKNPLFFRLASMFEAIGKYLYPALGGVHMIEASKQLYAGSRGTPARTKGSLIAAGKKVVAGKQTVPTPREKLKTPR